MATFQVPGADGCTSWKVGATSLAKKQYMAVVLSAANTVAICGSTTGQLLIGPLQNAPAAYEEAQVFTQAGGIAKVYAGETLATVGTPLGTDASGYYVAAADGDIINGYSLEAAGASGDIIRMLVCVPHSCANVSLYVSGS